MPKLVCAFALLALCSAPAYAQGGGVARLRDVRSVYVAQAGSSEEAKAFRREVVSELSKSKHFKVVDAPAEADAVLNVVYEFGTKNVDWQYQDFNHDLETRTGSHVVPDRRVVFSLQSKQGHALWSLKLDPNNYYVKNDPQRGRAFADRVSRELLKAFEKDSRRRS